MSVSNLRQLWLQTKAAPGRAGVRRMHQAAAGSPVHKMPGVSSAVRKAFEEALHPRGPRGRFAAKPASDKASNQRPSAPRQLVGQERLKSSGVTGDDSIVVQSKRVRKYQGHETVQAFVDAHPKGRAHALRTLAADHKAGRIGFAAPERPQAAAKVDPAKAPVKMAIDPKLADGSFRANTVPVASGLKGDDFLISLNGSKRYPVGITVEQFAASHPKGRQAGLKTIAADMKAGRLQAERTRSKVESAPRPERRKEAAATVQPGDQKLRFGEGTSESFREGICKSYQAVPAGVRSALEKSGYTIHSPLKTSQFDPAVAARSGASQTAQGNGRTLENAAGFFDPSSKSIVTNEMMLGAIGNKTTYIPNFSSNHVIRHEMGHAVDHQQGMVSQRKDYLAAYHADLKDFNSRGGVQADPGLAYFTQPGAVGPSETFAEVFAEHFGTRSGSANLRTKFPRSGAYVSRVIEGMK